MWAAPDDPVLPPHGKDAPTDPQGKLLSDGSDLPREIGSEPLTAAQVAAAAAVLQFAVLAAAAVYARGQLREARRLRLDTQRPFVVIDLLPNRPQFMDISIKNVGPLPARDVRF